MTKEAYETIEEFLANLADCTNKIGYISEQATVMEEDPLEALEIIKDYNCKITELANKFNEWLIGQNQI